MWGVICMENRKYVVNRDDIYVGEVVRTERIYCFEGNNAYFGVNSGQLHPSGWYNYRSMLFVPDEDGFSNDLLYKSPNYPVLNITDDETCLNLGEDVIVVAGAYSMSPLLEYFGYKKDLSYDDIMKIRKTFFNGSFAKDNCELFGWKETMAEDVIFYKNGVKIEDPRELERLRKDYRRKQRAGHRSFVLTGDGPLDEDYWHVLDDRGDNTLLESIQWREKINAFMPHASEGKIKRLSRF